MRDKEMTTTLSFHRCHICGGTNPDGHGWFFPENSEAYGAPQGKRRVIAYHVHKRCLETATERQILDLEDRLKEELLPPNRN